MSKIIDLDKENLIENESVIALGNFDGIHIGHLEIIKKTIEIAKENNLLSSVLLFKQHTNEVFPNFDRHYLTSLNDKIEILQNMGIDLIYTINFTYEFAQLTKEEFIFDFIVVRLNSKYIVCGPDYTFGKKSLGNTEDICTYVSNNRLQACIVNFYMKEGKKVSSTSIREYLLQGDIERANELLARNYSLKGKVVHGNKIGSSELGYPTANIETEFEYLIPREGVYLTYLIYENKKYVSMTSIGTNPTVTDNKSIKIEVYILDFNKKIYGEKVKIEFVEWMRGQIKFKTKKELIEQLNEDNDYIIKHKKDLQSK